jgi:hypothetical protein
MDDWQMVAAGLAGAVVGNIMGWLNGRGLADAELDQLKRTAGETQVQNDQMRENVDGMAHALQQTQFQLELSFERARHAQRFVGRRGRYVNRKGSALDVICLAQYVIEYALAGHESTEYVVVKPIDMPTNPYPVELSAVEWIEETR